MVSKEAKKKRALDISIKEGCAANVSSSLGDTYITPAVLALNGNAAHVGIVSAIAGLLNPISQLWGSKLMSSHERKNIVVSSASIQAISWILIAILPLAAYFTNKTSLPLLFLILIYFGIVTLGGILYPSFFSWMGDLVKEKERGKYFSRRSLIVGVVGLISTIVASLILDKFKTFNAVLIGFAVLFLIAGIFRFISRNYFTKQFEPKEKKKEQYEISWKKYISVKSKAGKFAIGLAAFNFAIMIASPFFAIYLLEEMQLSYLLFTIVSMGSIAWYLVFLPIVGKISDRYGNSLLLTISGILFTITPPMWIFINSPWVLLLGPQLLNGLANAAFAIGSNNYSYSLAKPQERGSTIAHVNALSGIGILIGSILGGLILQHWRNASWIFIVIFCLAAISRGLVTIFFLSRIKNEQKIKKRPFTFEILHPMKSFNHDLHTVRDIINK